jgi:hypothetical protein
MASSVEGRSHGALMVLTQLHNVPAAGTWLLQQALLACGLELTAMAAAA